MDEEIKFVFNRLVYKDPNTKKNTRAWHIERVHKEIATNKVETKKSFFIYYVDNACGWSLCTVDRIDEKKGVIPGKEISKSEHGKYMSYDMAMFVGCRFLGLQPDAIERPLEQEEKHNEMLNKKKGEKVDVICKYEAIFLINSYVLTPPKFYKKTKEEKRRDKQLRKENQAKEESGQRE